MKKKPSILTPVWLCLPLLAALAALCIWAVPVVSEWLTAAVKVGVVP